MSRPVLRLLPSSINGARGVDSSLTVVESASYTGKTRPKEQEGPWRGELDAALQDRLVRLGRDNYVYVELKGESRGACMSVAESLALDATKLKFYRDVRSMCRCPPGLLTWLEANPEPG